MKLIKANWEDKKITTEVDKLVSGYDDGELFVEEVYSENILLDDNRIKSASYDNDKGLRKRKYKKENKDETSFLEPLKIILNSGQSPAETWKKLFLGEWNNNVDMLYKTNYFKILKKNEKI